MMMHTVDFFQGTLRPLAWSIYHSAGYSPISYTNDATRASIICLYRNCSCCVAKRPGESFTTFKLVIQMAPPATTCQSAIEAQVPILRVRASRISQTTDAIFLRAYHAIPFVFFCFLFLDSCFLFRPSFAIITLHTDFAAVSTGSAAYRSPPTDSSTPYHHVRYSVLLAVARKFKTISRPAHVANYCTQCRQLCTRHEFATADKRLLFLARLLLILLLILSCISYTSFLTSCGPHPTC